MPKQTYGRVSRRELLAGTMASAAVFGTPSVVRAEPKSPKIGVLLPRSGYMAQGGQSCYRGALVAPKTLAEYGYRFEPIHADTESNPDTARTQAERLIDEGAHCIVGAFDSACTLAAAQVCEQREVPLVVNIGSAPQLTEQGYRFLVRNFPTGTAVLTNGLALIRDLLVATDAQPKTAVFLHANDNFGVAQRQAMDHTFPGSGLPFQLLASIPYDPKAQDLSVEVTKIRALNPDLLLVVTRSTDAIKLVRDMVRQHFQPMAVISPGSSGLYDEEFFQALGPLADYHVYTIPWANPKSQMTAALAGEFKQAQPNLRFPVECFNVGFTFEALLVAADAFRRAGTVQGSELMKALRDTHIADHVMIGPPIQFDAKGQNTGIPSACLQNRDRTPMVTLPSEVATIPPVLPEPPWQGRA